MLPPLMIDALLRIVAGRGSGIKNGIWLGVLVAAQLFIGEEALIEGSGGHRGKVRSRRGILAAQTEVSAPVYRPDGDCRGSTPQVFSRRPIYSRAARLPRTPPQFLT